jgi:hypothetical protein
VFVVNTTLYSQWNMIVIYFHNKSRSKQLTAFLIELGIVRHNLTNTTKEQCTCCLLLVLVNSYCLLYWLIKDPRETESERTWMKTPHDDIARNDFIFESCLTSSTYDAMSKQCFSKFKWNWTFRIGNIAIFMMIRCRT